MTCQRRSQETRVSKGGFVYKAPGEKITKHVISIALKARVTPQGRSKLFKSAGDGCGLYVNNKNYEYNDRREQKV